MSETKIRSYETGRSLIEADRKSQTSFQTYLVENNVYLLKFFKIPHSV